MNPEFGSLWQAIKIEADKSLCQRFDWRRGQMHSWRCYGFRAERVLLRWQNSFVSHFCLFYRFSRLVSLSRLQWQMFVIRSSNLCGMLYCANMNQEIRCAKNVKDSCSLEVCFLSINCPSGHFSRYCCGICKDLHNLIYIFTESCDRRIDAFFVFN